MIKRYRGVRTNSKRRGFHEKTEDACPGKGVTGYVSGSKVASIQQVEVMDPVSLSRQYPTGMPAARDVLDDE